MESVVEIRCVKALNIYILAENKLEADGTRDTNVTLFYVINWGPTKIEAKQESYGVGCEDITLQLNKTEESATTLSVPNVRGDAAACSKLKPVTWKLSQ